MLAGVLKSWSCEFLRAYIACCKEPSHGHDKPAGRPEVVDFNGGFIFRVTRCQSGERHADLR